MKFMKCMFVMLFFPFLSIGQNLPQCDSLVIQCCGLGNDSLTIQVANPTAELFDYPGFILFNSNMDTIAKETVNYFGIGMWPQQHILKVLAPLELSFNGYLNLYSWFYDSLSCSFPITIPDTISSGIYTDNQQGFRVYPNPTKGSFRIESGFQTGDFTLRILNVLGEVISESEYSITASLPFLIEGVPGLYVIELISAEGKCSRMKVVKM
ncbi:MAG: T9SS type A sorting domain-containing protein [Chitinophagaceae bacterium]|nr:T9SS type A sorting domain-containing protein [Chitinophagaceae bacterium]